jgi:fumarylacetoacetase
MPPSSLPRFLFPNSLVTDFTIHNLPYGVFRRPGASSNRIGVAIGDKIIDLAVLAEKQLLHPSLTADVLNPFMRAGKSVWSATRSSLKTFLSDTHAQSLCHNPSLLSEAVVSQSEVSMVLPAQIGDYTDFYASEFHAANVGKIFRPNQDPLLPNWKHIPVGYHGRASSVVVSGTDVRRPSGQLKRPNAIEFGPSEKMDFEVELGMFFGGESNPLGTPISIDNARDHIFGFTLLNDWSARDIQFWEYVPLGPFLSKNFATSISPWIVPLEAMEPFMIPSPQQNPTPLPYLQDPQNFSLDFTISTSLNSTTISQTNAKYLYWSFSQMIAHHTASGCNLRPGDLLGSGTISGPEKGEMGSMLELSWNGQQPINTAKGPRTFLQDNDTVTMTAHCEKNGIRIGFGECTGTLVE